jgi:hypothetical protein
LAFTEGDHLDVPLPVGLCAGWFGGVTMIGIGSIRHSAGKSFNAIAYRKVRGVRAVTSHVSGYSANDRALNTTFACSAEDSASAKAATTNEHFINEILVNFEQPSH